AKVDALRYRIAPVEDQTGVVSDRTCGRKLTCCATTAALENAPADCGRAGVSVRAGQRERICAELVHGTGAGHHTTVRQVAAVRVDCAARAVQCNSAVRAHCEVSSNL